MKAILTIGCGGSGKSSFARELIRENIDKTTGESTWVKIERDTIREKICVLHNNNYSIVYNNLWSYWNFKWEKEVNPIRDAMLTDSASKGKNVILSDTNLGKENREKLIKHVQSFGYDVETKVFGETLTLDDLWKHNLNRKNVLPHNVVADQYQRFRKEFPLYTLKDGLFTPYCVIYDIDGTIAHMVDRSPYEWDKVDTDIMDVPLFAGIMGQMYHGYEIIFMSGRDESCRKKTEDWIKKSMANLTSEPFNFKLYMRSAGDMRKDTAIKEELFFKYIDGNYRVQTVYDDRPVVCRLWRDMGFKVNQCANPWVEF